jgi:hypothetical protein
MRLSLPGVHVENMRRVRIATFILSRSAVLPYLEGWDLTVLKDWVMTVHYDLIIYVKYKTEPTSTILLW